MSRTHTTGAHAPAPQSNEQVRAALAEDLAALIADLADAHRVWIGAVERHRAAVRGADPSAMQESLAAQQQCAARVASLEERRRAAVDRAARLPEFVASPSRPRRGPLTLGEIASACPEPARSRLVQDADALRALIGELRRANSTLHAASAALLAHTEGLMRQIARRLSTAGTYGRRGFVEPAPALACALDLVR